MADKLKKKFDIIRLNHHYFWFLMALCISSFVYIATDAYSIQGISDSELFTLQSTMVKASSIIVSISMGFLVSLYFNIQKARFGNFKKFAELQEKLVMYQHSFYQLADQLSRNPNIDPRYPTDYKELQRDLEWWQNV